MIEEPRRPIWTPPQKLGFIPDYRWLSLKKGAKYRPLEKRATTKENKCRISSQSKKRAWTKKRQKKSIWGMTFCFWPKKRVSFIRYNLIISENFGRNLELKGGNFCCGRYLCKSMIQLFTNFCKCIINYL